MTREEAIETLAKWHAMSIVDDWVYENDMWREVLVALSEDDWSAIQKRADELTPNVSYKDAVLAYRELTGEQSFG